MTAGKERDWLQEVVSFVVPLAKSRGASTAACSTYPECVPDGTSPAAVEHRRLTAEVVELVGLLNQRSGHEVPLDSMQEALRRCAPGEVGEVVGWAPVWLVAVLWNGEGGQGGISHLLG
ncbi:hypothetical protein OG818_23560 [Streptomyces virginiae]|uniref:hypothetical protein n=1 Tax=Streptomyces virginiae TaxID=1961 RepID=UPI00225B95EE|nr:hypothetical protein [Streptomyces virginiae]MCX4718731.1 hypothetical protein [Streptomyces virginiae]